MGDHLSLISQLQEPTGRPRFTSLETSKLSSHVVRPGVVGTLAIMAPIVVQLKGLVGVMVGWVDSPDVWMEVSVTVLADKRWEVGKKVRLCLVHAD